MALTHIAFNIKRDLRRTFAHEGIHTVARESALFNVYEANREHWGTIHVDEYKGLVTNSIRETNKPMQRIAGLVAAVVVLLFGHCPVVHGAEEARGYIYDGTGRVSSLSIVINVTNHIVEIQGAESARINTSRGDMSGTYRDCGNDTFYCLTGMLEIVIPKVMPVKQWNYHGLSCRSVAQPGGATYRITCRSPKYRGRPTYTYSLSRGVVSIESSPIAGDYGYKLRGKNGLFSLGNNP